MFIYSYIYTEATEAENKVTVKRVVNEPVLMHNSFTQTHTEHAGFIFK